MALLMHIQKLSNESLCAYAPLNEIKCSKINLIVVGPKYDCYIAVFECGHAVVLLCNSNLSKEGHLECDKFGFMSHFWRGHRVCKTAVSVTQMDKILFGHPNYFGSR